MKLKKIISILILGISLITYNISPVYADSASVVTLGADLNEDQKNKMLKYFGVNKDNVVILEVNNTEERKYLEGIATESQIGTKTYSCAYVEPTNSNSGIKVKTANLTWVNSNMIASTLATSGMDSCNVVVASLFPVSGTGGLTGIMKAFEDTTGKPLDEEKKELASEELITTGDLANAIGQDKATGIINDAKTEIIKNNTKDNTQIAQTINNVTNNYNVNLNADQKKQIQDLMTKISKQDYDYSKMKGTLKTVSDNVDDNLKALGEKVNNSGFWDSVGDFFANMFDGLKTLFSKKEDLGILKNTNDNMLGNNAIISATENEAISSDKASTNKSSDNSTTNTDNSQNNEKTSN